MQVCTVASGKTAVIASGKPFRPSMTAISTSSTPRFFNSFMTRSQNFAPSLSAIWTALFADKSLVADLDAQRIEENQWVNRLQQPRLPGCDFIQHRIGDRGDQ